MRRYRFGWVAAVVAGGYVVAVIVSAVVAVVTEDAGYLRPSTAPCRCRGSAHLRHGMPYRAST